MAIQSAGRQGSDSGNSAPNKLELARAEAEGKGLLQALRPWPVLRVEALLSAGPALGAGLGPAVAAAGSGVAGTGPGEAFCCVPAWVSGVSLPDPTVGKEGGELKVSCQYFCRGVWLPPSEALPRITSTV